MFQQQPEATSLLGKTLYPPPIADADRKRMETDLAAAFDKVREASSAENIIWMGRRTAYLGRFREAIEVFSGGLRLYPDDPRLFRHRGHRFISVREFDRAIRDLEQAASLIKGKPDEVEPDGQPNARNIPTSTLHTNIWYHLALARYLKADYVRAVDDWKRTRTAGRNSDNLVSSTHWLYTTLRRAGRADEATAALEPIANGLDVVENGSYYSLCLLYKGVRNEADVLQAAGTGSAATAVRYGVSAWQLANGRRDDARKMWDQILAGPDWPSFGYIAAEADFARK